MPDPGFESPAGSRLLIAIGQVPLEIVFSSRDLVECAWRRYEAFVAPTAANPEPLQIRLGSEGPSEEEEPAFRHVLDDAVLTLRRDAAYFTGVRHEFALDSLLRILLSVLLPPRGGFLLHAATVVRNGRAYVFTGRSGAGKSTVAALSPAGTVLTDEISLLRREPDGWHAYGTPFWGEFRAAGSNRRAPLAGIFHLQKAGEHRAAPLTPVAGLRTLLPNVLFFSLAQKDNQALLELIGDAVREVPLFRLDFRRDAGFWEVLPS